MWLIFSGHTGIELEREDRENNIRKTGGREVRRQGWFIYKAAFAQCLERTRDTRAKSILNILEVDFNMEKEDIFV